MQINSISEPDPQAIANILQERIAELKSGKEEYDPRDMELLIECLADLSSSTGGTETLDNGAAKVEQESTGATDTNTICGLGEIVEVYDYTDEFDQLLYQSVRYEPKDFRQRRPDGNGGWIPSTQGVRKVLYRLSQLICAIRSGQTIFCVEGERDANTLAQYGLVGTTNVSGAGKWLPEYTEQLRGAKRVVVIADKDTAKKNFAGQKHAAAVATALAGVVDFVGVIELPDFGGKAVKDASDYFDAGATLDDFLKQADAAERFNPPADAPKNEQESDPVAKQYGDPFYYNDKGKIRAINERYWAGLFAAENHVLYSPEEKEFYLYQDTTGLWACTTAEAIREMISARILEESRLGVGVSLEAQIKQSNLNAVVSALRGIAEKRNVFQRDKRLIHVMNGVIRFAADGKITLSQPLPTDYSRNRAPYAFDPTAECPRFLNDLVRSAMSDDDVNLFQQWFGVALYGYNLPQRLLILDGTAGGGKSTAVNTIVNIIGVENTYELRTEYCGERFEQFRYRGKTLLIGADVQSDFMMLRGASNLKKLVGGDPLNPEAKQSNAGFSMRGVFNIIMTCNSRLRVRLEGDLGAWKRRLLIIRYDNPPVPPEKIINDFHLVLLEQEGNGILKWALEGFRKYRAGGNDYALTDAQQKRVVSLLAESDSLRLFVQNRIERQDSTAITTDELRAAYAEYCAEHDWTPLPARVLDKQAPELMLEYFQTVKANSVNGNQKGYRGVRLKA